MTNLASKEDAFLDTPDITADRLEALRDLIPEAFSEGKVDFDKLRAALGDVVDGRPERYSFTWAGKRDAIRLLQTPSAATLVPAPEESVNWDTTQHLFIEGDNLEVLKLLYKAYFGRVKLIYIDPPYNTGNDFVYPDDFADPLGRYLEITGQKDAAGNLLTSNPETSGRYHSAWLNMMYPRLFMARQLLRDDGVIFVSIDDNEAHNLRALLDEVFGAENFLTTLFIQVRYAGKTLTERNDYQKLIEQVHVYHKGDFVPHKDSEDYTTEKFCWRIREIGKGSRQLIGRRNVVIFREGEYEITRVEPSLEGLKETWATGTVLKANASGKFFGDFLAPRKDIDGLGCLYKVEGIGEDGLGYRYFTGPKRADATKGKFYSGVPLERRQELAEGSAKKYKPILNWYDFADAFGNCRHEGNIEFGSGKKPITFIKKLLEIGTDNSGPVIVLDFFAGSGSTAHAVLDLNSQDSGSRQYIMVQLPESIDRFDKDQKTLADFCDSIGRPRNLAEVTKERVRRVISQQLAKRTSIDGQAQLFSTDSAAAGDLGMRVFKLAPSTLRAWQGTAAPTPDEYVNQLALLSEALREGWRVEDVVWEVAIKEGFPLTSRVTKAAAGGQEVYRVEDPDSGRVFHVCLDDTVSADVAAALGLAGGDLLVVRDAAVDDTTAANLALQCRLKTL